jgi:formylglycine-generating enzyme required for sulfatase activity
MRRNLLTASVFSSIARLAFAVALALLGAAAVHAAQQGLSAATAEAPLSVAQERALKPMDAFKECGICPQMVVIPAGSFIMGSPKSEVGRIGNEGPQHEVTIAHQFAIGAYAVTFDEWDSCVADGGCNGYWSVDERHWGRGRRPVINVSWNDAHDYVVWLSKKTGRPYRLLSEAEREYVTRAGTTTPFWWGSSIVTSQANYDGDYPYRGGPKGEYRHQTIPVDSFLPNPWGLYQVHGNVAEWWRTAGTTATSEPRQMDRAGNPPIALPT